MGGEGGTKENFKSTLLRNEKTYQNDFFVKYVSSGLLSIEVITRPFGVVGQAQKLKKLSKNHVFCVFLQKYGQMAEI